MEYWSKIVPTLTNLINKNEVTSIWRLFDVIRNTTVYDSIGILSCTGLRNTDHLMAYNAWLLQTMFTVTAANSENGL